MRSVVSVSVIDQPADHLLVDGFRREVKVDAVVWDLVDRLHVVLDGQAGHGGRPRRMVRIDAVLGRTL